MLGALINVCDELIFVPFEQSLRADMMEPEQVGGYTGAFTAIQPMAQIICGLLVSTDKIKKLMKVSFFYYLNYLVDLR